LLNMSESSAGKNQRQNNEESKKRKGKRAVIIKLLREKEKTAPALFPLEAGLYKGKGGEHPMRRGGGKDLF